jgi:hypothetical protein
MNLLANASKYLRLVAKAGHAPKLFVATVPKPRGQKALVG